MFIKLSKAVHRRNAVFALLFCSALMALSILLVPETLPADTSATTGVEATPTMTINGSHALELTVNPGQFGTTDAKNLLITTTNYTGYTMTIAPSTGDSTELVNTVVNTATIPSIANTTTANNFQNQSSAAYGLSVDNGTNYLPVTTDATIKSTNAATDSTTGAFTLKLGAKTQADTPAGTYTKSFTLSATANPALYSVTFNANAGEDTVTNMPTGAQLSGAEVVLPFNPAPTRTGYRFLGWDTNDNATDPTYKSSGTTSFPIDPEQDQAGNTHTLYAIWGCGDGYICYDDNGADAVDGGKGTMLHTSLQSSAYSAGSSRTLIAPNYSKTGYGFVGWSTVRIDPNLSQDNTISDIKSNIAGLYTSQNPNEKIYGPNQTITMPNPIAPVQLYAVWLPAEKDGSNNPVYLQGWTGCSSQSMHDGDVVALTDSRDNEIYVVAKIARNVGQSNEYSRCWMIENLRTDVASTTFTKYNTNNPSQNFIQEATALDAAFWNACNSTSSDACLSRISYSLANIDRSKTASYGAANQNSSWYSYGGMYNWYTATAGYGT